MSGKLMDCYRAIEDSSARMLEAARGQDWEGVARVELVCTVQIEQLRQQARAEQLSPPQRVEKTRIMQRILRNEAQIRDLAEPWLARLDGAANGSSLTLH